MRARLRSLAAGLLVGLLALVQPGTAASAATRGSGGEGGGAAQCAPGVRVGPDGPDFYEPPSPLPSGAHGDMIWARRVAAPAHARACRVLYLSELHDGTPVAVSGLVIWPDGPAPGGGRHVVAWAHGTVGGPRQCAPSAVPDPAVNLINYYSYQSPYGIDVGIPALTDLLAAGDVVTATDYQGLGGPGVHEYLVGETETRNVLDSVLAARRIEAVHAGRDLAALGWSQGGGAAMFVGQRAPAYTPDLHLVGVAGLAPAADIGPQSEGLVLPGPHGTPDSRGAALRLNLYRGFLAAYPELKASDVLQPNGVAAMAGDEVACIEHFADVINMNVVQTHQLHTLFQPLGDLTPTWHARFFENTPGYAATVAPVLVMQGTDDTVIDPHSTTQYIRRACGFSQPVEYSTYQGASHETIPVVAQQEYLSWIAARFAGQQAPSNC
jgi:alpha-beta hydrolase superfamily lysophospholipase